MSLWSRTPPPLADARPPTGSLAAIEKIGLNEGQGPEGVSLPPQYSLFGQVTKGQDVADAIGIQPRRAEFL